MILMSKKLIILEIFFLIVCESVLNKLKDQLPNDAKQDEIEIAFKDFCKKSKGKEERFVSVT